MLVWTGAALAVAIHSQAGRNFDGTAICPDSSRLIHPGQQIPVLSVETHRGLVLVPSRTCGCVVSWDNIAAALVWAATLV